MVTSEGRRLHFRINIIHSKLEYPIIYEMMRKYKQTTCIPYSSSAFMNSTEWPSEFHAEIQKCYFLLTTCIMHALWWPLSAKIDSSICYFQATQNMVYTLGRDHFNIQDNDIEYRRPWFKGEFVDILYTISTKT